MEDWGFGIEGLREGGDALKAILLLRLNTPEQRGEPQAWLLGC